MRLGCIYKDLGKLDRAQVFLLKSLELKLDYHQAYMNLGSVYRVQGNLDQAIASTLKSIELKGDYQEAFVSLGLIYLEKGEFLKSISVLKQAISLKETPSVYINLSLVYGKLNDKDLSIKYALKVVELDDKNEVGYINLANQCLKFDRVEQGIDAAMKAIDINETSEQAYLIATKLLCTRKSFSARETLERLSKTE